MEKGKRLGTADSRYGERVSYCNAWTTDLGPRKMWRGCGLDFLGLGAPDSGRRFAIVSRSFRFSCLYP